MVDGLALALLAGLTLWLAWRGRLEGTVLLAALFILPGTTTLEHWAGAALGGGGHRGLGPLTALLILGAAVEESGRYVLLSVSARRDGSAVTAGYAWAAWELALALTAGLRAGGNGSLMALADLLMMRALPSLLHVGLSFLQLWAVRAGPNARRGLLFITAIAAHLAFDLLVVRHGHF